MASEVWFGVENKNKSEKHGEGKEKKIKSTITQLLQWMDLAGGANSKTPQRENKNREK